MRRGQSTRRCGGHELVHHAGRTPRARWRILVAGAVLAAVLVGCTGGGDDDQSSDSDPVTKVPRGGTLVLAAGGQPACADWIAPCATPPWGLWTMQQHTMPRAFDIVARGGSWVYEPSPLLAGEPKLDDGPPQTVTYRIARDAVWSDGTPITSQDFAYTATQIRDGDPANVYDKTGYVNIERVDTPDPKTAVVVFKTPYGSWQQLFGTTYGIFPSHILEGKDRAVEMNNGYSWSGGPWLIEAWQRDVEVSLVPNPQYWGPKPRLDRVVFKYLPDPAAELTELTEGRVLAVYRQQFDPEGVVGLTAVRGFDSSITSTTASIEALWINNERPPFDDARVRRAFAFALDRAQIVEDAFGALGVDRAANSLNPPVLAPYSDQSAWRAYRRKPARVAEEMTAAEYARNAAGLWEKEGATAAVQLVSTDDDRRRAAMLEGVKNQLVEAGFDASVLLVPRAELFGQRLPFGDFQVALYANVAPTLEPILCAFVCAQNIPGPANDGAGQNFSRIDVPPADEQLAVVEVSTDAVARSQAGRNADRILAEAQVSLPLTPIPNVALWSRQIVGDISDNPILAIYWNLNEWGLRPPPAEESAP